MHTHTRTYTHTTHVHTHTTHTYTRTPHTHIHTYTHTQQHTCTHHTRNTHTTHVHTHTTHTYVHTLAQANLVGLPSLVVNRVMRRQPLNIHYLCRYLTKPQDNHHTTSTTTSTTTPITHSTPTKKFSLFSRQKTSSTASAHNNSNMYDDPAHPDCSLITPEIPTPDAFHDQTGYTFSAVTLGSNPLYNWSMTSTSTSTKEKNGSLEVSSEEEEEEGGEGEGSGRDAQRRFEESESILDFRVTSVESGDKRQRPGYLWLPSLRNLSAQGLVPPTPSSSPAPATAAAASGSCDTEEEEKGEELREGGGTGGSPPSSDCDNNCKRQLGQKTSSGLSTGE